MVNLLSLVAWSVVSSGGFATDPRAGGIHGRGGAVIVRSGWGVAIGYLIIIVSSVDPVVAVKHFVYRGIPIALFGTIDAGSEPVDVVRELDAKRHVCAPGGDAIIGTISSDRDRTTDDAVGYSLITWRVDRIISLIVGDRHGFTGIWLVIHGRELLTEGNRTRRIPLTLLVGIVSRGRALTIYRVRHPSNLYLIGERDPVYRDVLSDTLVRIVGEASHKRTSGNRLSGITHERLRGGVNPTPSRRTWRGNKPSDGRVSEPRSGITVTATFVGRATALFRCFWLTGVGVSISVSLGSATDSDPTDGTKIRKDYDGIYMITNKCTRCR